MSTTVLPRIFGREVSRIHCVGVGGMGVGPLAIYLSRCGFRVTGEDDALTEEMARQLRDGGVQVRPIPDDGELVVYSSAIAAQHPAHVAAAARGLPLVRRGEMLAEIVRRRKLVAVCGSHGKTTTTAMLITALRAAGFPAGYVLGGLFANDTPPAEKGENDWVVAEIDESDGTIGRFAPAITVCVNLDWDHPDRYPQLADLERAFAALFDRTTEARLLNASCEMSARVAGTRTRQTFGRGGDFDGEMADETRDGLTLRLGGRFAIRTAVVRAAGNFNALNATAALAAAHLMGATPLPASLAHYPGVRRRQAILNTARGVTMIEDYAHHPAEIRALLESLRKRRAGGGRLLAVFQPHRFSRTAQFRDEFAAALALADRVYLLEVYSAGEASVAGGTTAAVAAALRRRSPELPVAYEGANEDALWEKLARELRSGDSIVFVGAGDIDRKARTWLERWRHAQ